MPPENRVLRQKECAATHRRRFGEPKAYRAAVAMLLGALALNQ
ncbi:hypothetical protein OHAE_3105 [Ochrobactrum soli]|uniref:Uncharacterized protein n=1 Tax=Ochrobactrum soli TaxID=2448455 RepID=A0A2P9HGH0_9HYPH|nr:hypothetical protein OHAE_3105 [[Ochrobactrum] soli]